MCPCRRRCCTSIRGDDSDSRYAREISHKGMILRPVVTSLFPVRQIECEFNLVARIYDRQFVEHSGVEEQPFKAGLGISTLFVIPRSATRKNRVFPLPGNGGARHHLRCRLGSKFSWFDSWQGRGSEREPDCRCEDYFQKQRDWPDARNTHQR